MQALEEKKIIIKLPRFHLRSFLSLRFFAIVTLLLFSSFFAYWYKAIRPFLWITSAHVEAYSSLIKSDFSGRIVEIGPQEGEKVRKGQTLFVLDRDLLFAKQAQAKLALNALIEQVDKEKGRMGKAMQDYLAASDDLEIKKQLAIMDEAQEKSEVAASKIPSAQTELNYLDLQVKKMCAIAPFDAIILKCSQHLGSILSFGDPVYLLCDPNRIWIDAEVPEKEISRVQINSPVRVRLPAYPNQEFAGKVAYISPATASKSSLTSAQNENIPIKVALDNPPQSLRPGLSASVALKVR